MCNFFYSYFFEYLVLSTIIFKIKNERGSKKSFSLSEIVSNGIKIVILINKNSLQAVTRELREQSALLQTTRAELQRIKQPLSAMHSNSTSVFSTSTPPPSLTASTGSDKKQSNTSNYEIQSAQEKRRQIDDIMRKVFISNFTYLF